MTICNSNWTFQLSTSSCTKIPEVTGTTDHVSTFEINCSERCEKGRSEQETLTYSTAFRI
jgi:hypothetical protein